MDSFPHPCSAVVDSIAGEPFRTPPKLNNGYIQREILHWDYNARRRYIECAKKGIQTIHRARAMIVGCACAGKTSLLQRLQKISLHELQQVQSTVGLEVHEDNFEIVEDKYFSTELDRSWDSLGCKTQQHLPSLVQLDGSMENMSTYAAINMVDLCASPVYPMGNMPASSVDPIGNMCTSSSTVPVGNMSTTPADPMGNMSASPSGPTGIFSASPTDSIGNEHRILHNLNQRPCSKLLDPINDSCSQCPIKVKKREHDDSIGKDENIIPAKYPKIDVHAESPCTSVKNQDMFGDKTGCLDSGNSKDPLSDLTNDQRVVLYTLFLCEDWYRGVDKSDDDYAGDIFITNIVKELENKGLVKQSYHRYYILNDKESMIMKSYRENCLLSDIDKDFFIQVASDKTIKTYAEMYCRHGDGSRQSQDLGPITAMRLILEGHGYRLPYFVQDKLPACPLDDEKELGMFGKFLCKARNTDPVSPSDQIPHEKVTNFYSAFTILSGLKNELMKMHLSKKKWSTLISILLSEEYFVCENIPCIPWEEKRKNIQQTFKAMQDGKEENTEEDLVILKELEHCDELLTVDKENNKVYFVSEEIRHQVMGYFVLNCLESKGDYENYLKLSSVDSIFEYARPLTFERRMTERCMYIPKGTEELFVDRLGVDAIQFAANNYNLRIVISSKLNTPKEVLKWDYDARCRYIACAKKGTQTMHRARAMIVGCAGAGKTTLLRRLQQRSIQELRQIQSTVGLEVYDNLFEVDKDRKCLRGLEEAVDTENKCLLSVMDFAGQCAYYACHQVYLSRRAFYLLVIDMSKRFDEKVDQALCEQEGTMFADWTFGHFVKFWIESIRMYGCEKAPVIQVLTSEHSDARENSWSSLQDCCHERGGLILDEDLCVQILAHEMDSETFLLQDLFKKFDVTGLSLNCHKESTEERFSDWNKTLMREEHIFKDVVENEDIWWIMSLILRRLLTTSTVDLNFQYMQCLDLMMTMEISLYQQHNLSMYTRIYGTKEPYLEIKENLNPSLISNFHLQPCWFYFCIGLDCLTSHIQDMVDNMISLFEYTAYFLYEQHIVTIAVRNSEIQLQIIHLKEQPDDEETKGQGAEKSVQRLQKCAPNLALKGHLKQDKAGDTELTVDMEEEEEEEDSLETEYVELSDLEDDCTSSDNEEGQDIEINFSVQQPKETEESYRQSRRNLYSSRSFIIIGDIEKSEKGSDGSVSSEERQQTYRNLLNSAEQERRRKVFCESSFYDDDEGSFGWNSGELYSGSSLDSGEIYKDGNLKDTIHVSQNVTLWDKGIVPENSWIDVNYIVNQLVCLHENKNQEDSKMIEAQEKVEKKCFAEEKIKMFCPETDTVFSKKEEVLKESKGRGRGKKRNSSRSKFRREKRRARRSLREIINWQISLRRNAAVLCDYNSESGGQVSCALPAETNGSERIQEIANRELNNGIVQSASAEENPNIGEQQNGLPNGNSATFPRYVSERNQAGNMDASRHFFSNPTMVIERPQVEPLTRSLPAIHTEGPHTGGLSASEALPRIEESEALSTLITENAVPPTEEKESQGIIATEEAVSSPSHPSVPPEADSQSMTSTSTPSQPSVPPEAGSQSMTSTSTPSHPSVPPEADGQSMTSTETLSSVFSSVSLSSVEEDEAFRYEWIRLKTFSTWPLTSLFSTAMARGGWVALGEGDKARCYSCHVVHQGWRIGDKPLDFHDRHCRFLQSVSDNVPIIREEPAPTLRTVERDRERLPEYCEVAPQGNVTGQVPRPEEERNIVMNLTSKDVGEPFQEERGNLVVESSNPGNVTTNLQMSERPPVYNSSYTSRPAPQLIAPVESNPILKHSPSNPQGHSAAGPPPLPPGREAQLEALRRDPMGINFDRPKYPSYAILAVRISSFTDWPTAMTQTPRDMALAGFFYAGYGDYTRCFFCGGGLRNWEAGDDPWVEHARWFSKCAFVRQNRGQQFIDLVLRRAAEMEEQRSQDEAGNSQTNAQTNTQTNTQTSDAAQTLAKEEKIMKSAAVISIKDMGYSEDIIKTAITTIKSRLPRGKHKVSAQEILEVIFELADSQRASENSSSQSEPHRNVHQSESSSAPAVHSGATTENVTNNVSQSNSTTDKTDQSTSEEAAATGSSNAGEVGTGESISNFLSNPTYDELTSLRQENTSLKDQIVCKICMEKNVSIAFLPCGHLACCADCAPAMRKCPICREFVRGTVKTYLV